MTPSSTAVRALACPHCGAKLRWDGDAPIVECRYCHTHVVVETGTRTDLPAAVVSQRGLRPLVVVCALGGVALLVASVALLAPAGGPRRTTTTAPTKMTSVAELLATPLRARPDQIAARHGVAVVDTTVLLHLSDGAFREAALFWDRSDLAHVRSITLWPRQAGADLSDVVARARALVGPRLRAAATGGYQFHSKNVSLVVSSIVAVDARPSDDPAWQEQLSAMWVVLRASAFATSEVLDERTRRDVLNLSYPLGVLAELAPEVNVDDAKREVHRVAPGADSAGPRHTIGVEHPWFETVTLGWENQPRGAWTQAILYFAKEVDFAAQHPQLVACLAPVLGEPKRLVSDHLAGTFTLQFPAHGGRPWVDVGAHGLQFYPHYRFGDPVTNDGIHALVSALAACARK
ncbi:MAG: hypothetical protein SFX73_10745 [Kofleriaceae bacterium]|nr:hypothetical protein [Kofleriaceae bacterium]